jgi:hypothetical protein
MALHCQVSLLHLFLSLSQIFQKTSVDVLRARDLIDLDNKTIAAKFLTGPEDFF